MRNPFTGFDSPGYRFRLNCRPISHSPLYLPLAMKSDPLVIRLRNGESPLSVFSVSNIRDARQAFHTLREKYDFTFWAARQFFVKDINDPDTLVPLILNNRIDLVISIMEERYFDKKMGRYVITKSGGPCGLTTALQAYVLWRILYSPYKGTAHICGASKFNTHHLKANLARFLHLPSIPSYNRIYFSPYGGRPSSFLFSSVKNPDATRGIDLNYAIFSDISKWHDHQRINSNRAAACSLGSVLLDYNTLFIYEGNLPNDFPKYSADTNDYDIDSKNYHQNLQKYYDKHVKDARSPAPIHIEEALYSLLHPDNPPFRHISI